MLPPAFAIGAAQVRVGVSIGAATVGRKDDAACTDDLLSRADIAMYSAKYAAKRAARPAPVLFREGLKLPGAADWKLRPPLEQAIRDGVVVPHYQPIVELATGHVHGFEALARWPHGGEVVQPQEFLPVAARASLMPALTTHLLRKASAQAVDWTLRPGLGHLRIAVNVPPSLIIDEAFPDVVHAVTQEYDVPVGALVVEITEEALLTDLDAAVRVAERLRQLGVLICLDDFGTGYSSLAHLHRLPLDRLKLDRAFVSGIDHDGHLRQLLSGVLSLGRGLGLSVVAEGIEREAQANTLRDLGCELGQGFLFSRPLDPRACEPLLERAAAYGTDVVVPLQTARSA